MLITCPHCGRCIDLMQRMPDDGIVEGNCDYCHKDFKVQIQFKRQVLRLNSCFGCKHHREDSPGRGASTGWRCKKQDRWIDCVIWEIPEWCDLEDWDEEESE